MSNVEDSQGAAAIRVEVTQMSESGLVHTGPGSDELVGGRTPQAMTAQVQDLEGFIAQCLRTIQSSLSSLTFAEATSELTVAVSAETGLPYLTKLRGEGNIRLEIKWIKGD